MLTAHRLEPTRRRIRAAFGGEIVADSARAWVMLGGYVPPAYELGNYGFPGADVRTELLETSDTVREDAVRGPVRHWTVAAGGRRSVDDAFSYVDPPEAFGALRDLVFFRWNVMDHFYEEDEEVYVHPRGPYHRVDVLNGSRHVRVSADGVLLAETRRPRLLFETGMPTRTYIPAADVRMDLLEPSDTRTQCPYKGVASYLSLRDRPDIAWTYPSTVPECRAIVGRICFFDERLDVEVDGERQHRPGTKWVESIPARDRLGDADAAARRPGQV